MLYLKKFNMDENKYLTISALNRYIKYKFEYDKNLSDVLVSAEISNFKRHATGHLYFSLKDETSQMKAMMFSRDAARLLFNPKDGDKVYLRGSIKAYEKNGEYQIYVSEMKLSGIGDLYLKFEKLKKELEAKGLFSVSHKRPIPKYPKCVGVITSDTGAAIHDILTTIKRRYPLTRVLLYPALVQGESAKESIVSQIKAANRDKLADVLIVGRGGGSLEDLWAFNEEIVAYAIYDSAIPVISAVGHEVDFSISDFVADVRAATPTAAAEIATPNIEEIKENIKSYVQRTNKSITKIIEDKEEDLVHLDLRLEKSSPIEKLKKSYQDISQLTKQMNTSFSHLLDIKKSNIDLLNSKLNPNINSILNNKTLTYKALNMRLDALSPLKVMDKGFSIASSSSGVIRSVLEVKINEDINIRVKDGNIKTKVIEVYKDGK